MVPVVNQSHTAEIRRPADWILRMACQSTLVPLALTGRSVCAHWVTLFSKARDASRENATNSLR